MSGIQRWSTLSNELRIASASYPNDDEEGEVEVVTYTDHAAYVAVAVAEAEQRGWNAGFDRSNEMAREDALAAAREAVAAIWTAPDGVWLTKSEALAAIDNLKGESNV